MMKKLGALMLVGLLLGGCDTFERREATAKTPDRVAAYKRMNECQLDAIKFFKDNKPFVEKQVFLDYCMGKNGFARDEKASGCDYRAQLATCVGGDAVKARVATPAVDVTLTAAQVACGLNAEESYSKPSCWMMMK